MTGHLPIVTWILVSIVFPLQVLGANFENAEDIEARGPTSDLMFLSGQNIRSSVQSSNDLFMAGRSITQTGGGAENLFAAGGNIDLLHPNIRLGVMAGGNLNVFQAQTNDLILAGGRIRVDQSKIQNNLILAGGQIDVGQGTTIENSVILGGREIFFTGRAGGDVEIAGGEVHLTGEFGKNVHVRAQHLVLGPHTTIAGDFSHAVDKLEMDSTVTISGRDVALPTPETSSGSAVAAAWISGVLFLLGILLAPPLVAFLFPRFFQGANTQIRSHFWENVGKGSVGVLIAPILIVLLFMSVVGIPVAFFALPFLVVAVLTAWSIALFVISQQLRIWIFRGRNRPLDPEAPLGRGRIFAWTLLGAFITFLAFFIPLVGFFFCFILFLAGVGSIYSQMRGRPPQRLTGDFKERSTGFVPVGSPS